MQYDYEYYTSVAWWMNGMLRLVRFYGEGNDVRPVNCKLGS